MVPDKIQQIGDTTITFNDTYHTYKDDKGVKYTPVSSVINKFKVPFDKNIAVYVAKKENRTVAEVLAEWKAKGDISLVRGNYFHNSMELLLKYPLLAQNSDLESEYKQIVAQVPKGYELNIEEIVACPKTRVAGTADLIITKGKQAIVFDWKSNELYGKKVYNNFKGILSHLEDTKINHYTIQLNIYRYLKELQGYKVKKMVIGNWQNNNVEFIEVERLEDDVVEVILSGEVKK